MEKETKKELEKKLVKYRDQLLALGIKDLVVELKEDKLLVYWNNEVDDGERLEDCIPAYATEEDIERWYK